jgi:hypothetical protein
MSGIVNKKLPVPALVQDGPWTLSVMEQGLEAVTKQLVQAFGFPRTLTYKYQCGPMGPAQAMRACQLRGERQE